jgi:hypothetical protein
VPDLPGFGDSGKPEEVLDVTELADWMKPLDSEASLLGDFFGCQVIADLARALSSRACDSAGSDNAPDDGSVFWLSNQRHDRSHLPTIHSPGCELVRQAGFLDKLKHFREFPLQCGLPPTGMILSSANMICSFLVIIQNTIFCAEEELLLQGMHRAGKN